MVEPDGQAPVCKTGCAGSTPATMSNVSLAQLAGYRPSKPRIRVRIPREARILDRFPRPPHPSSRGGGVVSFHPGWGVGLAGLETIVPPPHQPSQGEGLRRLRGTVKIRRARRVPPSANGFVGGGRLIHLVWKEFPGRPRGAAPVWTGGRAVEGYCLENSRAKAPWVRIPPRPLLCWCAFPVSRRVASHDSAIMGCIR